MEELRMILSLKHMWKCRQLFKWRQAALFGREIVSAECDNENHRQPQYHPINLSQWGTLCVVFGLNVRQVRKPVVCSCFIGSIYM